MELNTHTSRTVKTASTITLLAGIWLFISPWLYAVSRMHDSWDSWVVGLALIVLAAIRVGNPEKMPWLSWLNCLLGVWTFASPWIFRYTHDTGWYISSLGVGAVVFVTALRSATATPRTGPPLAAGA
jgi:hypothetical protein